MEVRSIGQCKTTQYSYTMILLKSEIINLQEYWVKKIRTLTHYSYSLGVQGCRSNGLQEYWGVGVLLCTPRWLLGIKTSKEGPLGVKTNFTFWIHGYQKLYLMRLKQCSRPNSKILKTDRVNPQNCQQQTKIENLPIYRSFLGIFSVN